MGGRTSVLGAEACLEVGAEHGHVGPDTHYSGVESRTAGCDLLRHAGVEQGQHGGVEC